MSMKTVFNITNYKIKPEEIWELLRKLKTSSSLGFPLQGATWLAGFTQKHSSTLSISVTYIHIFLAYKYQPWHIPYFQPFLLNPPCKDQTQYSKLVLLHLTQYNRKPRRKQIYQIISFSSNLNAPTKKIIKNKHKPTNIHGIYGILV